MEKFLTQYRVLKEFGLQLYKIKIWNIFMKSIPPDHPNEVTCYVHKSYTMISIFLPPKIMHSWSIINGIVFFLKMYNYTIGLRKRNWKINNYL